MKNVLVTGGNGQLGTALWDVLGLEQTHNENNYTFTDVDTFDLLDTTENIENYLLSKNINVIVNCAAYTNVDKAETDFELCNQINNLAVEKLAHICEKHDILLIQISTDYVFSGEYSTPLTENETVSPKQNYGYTKFMGEQAIRNSRCKHFILRTSWLYYEGEFKNFVNTIVNRKEDINVVFDQTGTPTYAADLAKTIIHIINTYESLGDVFGTYHYSNEGVCTWYDFAQMIKEMYNKMKGNLEININPIRSSQYKTPAQRPSYSVLDKTKIKETFDIQIPYWTNSLYTMLVHNTILNIRTV